MHWIQTIRGFLELSREELAHNLQLSTHTIVSVENNRRQLPIDILLPAITLYNLIKSCHTPPKSQFKENLRHAYPLKRFHRQCYRRLDLYDLQLKKMQDAYTTAHLRLEIYQSLMRALAAANNKADHARLRWTQEKISEAMQQVEANNPTAQHLLAAEKKYDRCALKKILC